MWGCCGDGNLFGGRGCCVGDVLVFVAEKVVEAGTKISKYFFY